MRATDFVHQLAALAVAWIAGLGEFAALQAWRLRERLGRADRQGF